jgi:hypothetical protein
MLRRSTLLVALAACAAGCVADPADPLLDTAPGDSSQRMWVRHLPGGSLEIAFVRFPYANVELRCSGTAQLSPDLAVFLSPAVPAFGEVPVIVGPQDPAVASAVVLAGVENAFHDPRRNTEAFARGAITLTGLVPAVEGMIDAAGAPTTPDVHRAFRASYCD